MKKCIFGLVIVLSLTFITGEGFSYPFEKNRTHPPKEKMAKIRKRVETLKMWKLTKVLDLDEKGAARLFPIINEYDKKRFTVMQVMRKNMHELRESVDTATESELRDMIEKLNDNHKSLQEIDGEEMKMLGEVLKARDMARFIIFKQEFDRDMKRIIADVREKRGRKLRDKPGVPPVEEPRGP